MHITNLGGHSGCRVLLYESEDNQTFVRKISSGQGYNKRLQVQAKKQEEFSDDIIKTPAVLNTGMDENGLFFFDMEYIQGITLAEYMKTIEIGKVKGLVETIIKSVIPEDTVSANTDESVFLTKIECLRKQIGSCHNATVEKALSVLSTHSWNRFKKTVCHGDLTLENIILKDSQLYLIDFLDSFYDSWLIDIGTLLQDAQTMWAYRYQENVDINTVIRLVVFRDTLMDSVRRVAACDYLEVYYALLLKLVRIYPYVKDDKTYRFLNEKTESVLTIIRREQEHANINCTVRG